MEAEHIFKKKDTGERKQKLWHAVVAHKCLGNDGEVSWESFQLARAYILYLSLS